MIQGIVNLDSLHVLPTHTASSIDGKAVHRDECITVIRAGL